MSDKIRVFIGSSPNGEDALAEMAYEYTLRKNASRELEIIWMRQTHDTSSYWHGFDASEWNTPFSGFRWAIPHYCNYEGKAIYTDSDMLNFCDMAELIDTPMGDSTVLARSSERFNKELCVLVINCEKFQERPKSFYQDKDTHGKMYSFFTGSQGKHQVGDLDPAWNSLDGDIIPFKQLHYTNMLTQPWKPAWFQGVHKPHEKPVLEKLFWQTVEAAKAEGYNPLDYDPCANYDHKHVNLDVKRSYY